MELLICHLLLIVTVVSGQFRVRPENTAAVVGTTVTLQCRGEQDHHSVIWIEFVTNTELATSIAFNDKIESPPNREIYSVSSPAGGQWDLDISLLRVSGGRYRCQDFTATPTAITHAHITVLDNEPQCSNDINTDGVVVDGETVRFTCSVSYTSTSIDWPPTITWSGPDNPQPIDDSTPGTVRVSIDVTGAPELDGAVYSSTTQFESFEGTLPSDHATNTPSYRYDYNPDPLNVHYPPQNMELSPDKDNFSPGEVITCTAVSKPGVQYTWYNTTDNSTVSTDSDFTVTDNMVGVEHSLMCEAWNTIRLERMSKYRYIIFTVTTPPTTTTTTTPDTTTTDTPVAPTSPDGSNLVTAGLSTGAKIGIGVGCGLAVVVIIIIAIYFLWCRRRKVPPPTHKDMTQTMSKVHGDQIRNSSTMGPPGTLPDGSPPPYQTYDSSRTPYEAQVPPHTNVNQPQSNVDGVVYADLALDDTPRSRKPIQVFENTEYAEVQQRV